MSLCTSIVEAPSTAVMVPITKATWRVVGLLPKRGANRLIKNPPALMMLACRRPVTGVGANSELGKHKLNGNWADLPMAPTNMSRVMAVAASISIPGQIAIVMCKSFARANKSGSSTVPYTWHVRMIPIKKAMSARRRILNILYAPSKVGV